MNLTAWEDEAIERCVLAAIEGGLFPDVVFQTLIGFDRKEALGVLRARKENMQKEYEQLTHNVLNNLIGYPHHKADELFARTHLDFEAIETLFGKFRTTSNRASAKNQFEGME